MKGGKLKRAPRLFYLLAILNSEEKELVVQELKSHNGSRIATYLLNLIYADTIDEMHQREKAWKNEERVGDRYIGMLRRKAYWLVLEILDKYLGAGTYIPYMLRLHRIRMPFWGRKGSEKALPSPERYLAIDNYAVWFFYNPAWWLEYTLYELVYDNIPFTKCSNACLAFKSIQNMYIAFKLLSALRRMSPYAPQDCNEVSTIIKTINELTGDKKNIVYNAGTLLVLFSIILFTMRVGFFATYSEILQEALKWEEPLKELPFKVMKKYHIPLSESSTMTIFYNKLQEVLYAFPANSVFMDISELLKRRVTVPFDDFWGEIRKGTWYVLNGSLEAGYFMLQRGTKQISPEKMPPHIKDMYYIAMMWYTFVIHRSRRKVAPLLQSISYNKKQVYNMLYHMYLMLFGIEEKKFHLVRSSGDTIYRYALRNNILLGAARALRWLSRNISEENIDTIWGSFKERLLKVYEKEPWNVYLETLLPWRWYIEARLKNKSLLEIALEVNRLKWLNPQHMEERVGGIYQVSIGRKQIVKAASLFTEELYKYMKKL